jgi:hypothetical protein
MKRLQLVCFLFQILLSSSAFGADVEPGGTAGDALLAVTNPDEYAWKLFLFINQQAKSGSAGLPDPGKPDLKSYDPVERPRMPLHGPYWDDARLQKFKGWMDEGLAA